MIVAIIAGARPNFMKVAPIIKAIKEARAQDHDIDYKLIHTGQHYDKKMSGDFFEQLGIPEPDVNLEAGGGSQAEQTAAIMTRFEKVMESDRPDVVLVVGDVTSTMACTIVAKKLCIPVVHVEAGIRSGDMTMPEEINRIVTDSICDHFFTTSEVADKHLRKSGVEDRRIHFVGNTMIDTLFHNLDRLQQPEIWKQFGLRNSEFFLVTLHRPANVDDPYKLKTMLDAILEGTGSSDRIPGASENPQKLEVIKYSHPRLLQVEPMGYLEFIYMVKNAKGVITDSGGITEETTVLKVPCITLRDSTERPETVTMGSNELVGTDPSSLAPFLERLLAGQWKKGNVPPLWDGKTSPRIVAKLIELYSRKGVEV